MEAVERRVVYYGNRTLVAEVLGVDPIDCPRGQTEKRWGEITDRLKSLVDLLGSVVSCKKRIDELIKFDPV